MSLNVTTLEGDHVRLRLATASDVPELARIRATPEVLVWWRGGEDMAGAGAEDRAEEGAETFVIEHDGRVAGAVQWRGGGEARFQHTRNGPYTGPPLPSPRARP